MTHAGKFGRGVLGLSRRVNSAAEISDSDIAKLVQGTNLQPTSTVCWIVRWGVNFVKTGEVIVEGQPVNPPAEVRDATRGAFFFVHLGAFLYRWAEQATKKEREARRPTFAQPPDSVDDLDMLFGSSFALPG